MTPDPEVQHLPDRSLAATSADGSCSCVPPLVKPADRLTDLRTMIGEEVEPVVSLTHLLRLCRDEHRVLWEHHADPRCRTRVKALVDQVGEALPEPGLMSTISGPARRALAAALEPDPRLPAVVVAHALAELLDARFGHSFADWFRGRSPYQPAVGDPIPLDHPDLPRIISMPPTAPPWRLANRLDETRGVRLAGGWTTQFRVVFDYSLSETLAGLVGPDTVVATGHPNHDLGELVLPEDRREPAFPVQPVDLVTQRERITRLLVAATGAGASVVVLPELSVTEEIAVDLEQWVRRAGSIRLLVAGSFHHRDREPSGRRSNRALAWVRGHAAPLSHDKHSPADRPAVEDISPAGWPELRVYVTADGWHLVIAICRDLLNPHALHALAECGVNLVLAPSMSETLVAFAGPVAQLVGSGQAVVAVANNPADWSDPDRPEIGGQPPRALFGHPGFPRLTRLVHAHDREVGLAMLHVGLGQVSWLPVSVGATARPRSDSPASTAGPYPLWLPALGSTSPLPAAPAPSVATLRPAAVLIVLVDADGGPEVLLTERAADLTHYGGQLVFPGGAADPTDPGIVDTALREAEEETGLDATSVHVIGTLPPFGLPETGFLVTPVLAWTRELQFTHRINPAEVAATRLVRLRSWSRELGERRLGADGSHLGVMTGTILELLAARIDRESSCRPSEHDMV